MGNNIKLSPNQLKVVTDHIINTYKIDYEKGDVSAPHFEHIKAGDDYYKIGYMPNIDGGNTVMNIKIVYKGKN